MNTNATQPTHQGLTPFELEIGSAIISLVMDQGDESPFMKQLLPLLRDGLYYQTGVRLPSVTVRGRDGDDFNPEKFVISIREVPVFEGRIQANSIVVGVSADELVKRDIRFVPSEHSHPEGRYALYWISEEHAETAKELGWKKWDVAEYLILMLAGVARRHLAGFLTLATVYKMVNELSREHPQFVKDVVDYRVSLVKLADAFKILVAKGHSIRDLESLFEVLARHAHPEMSEKELALLLEKSLAKRREKLVLNSVPEMNDALFAPQPVVVVLTGKVAQQD